MTVLSDAEITKIQSNLSQFFENGIACLDLFVEAKDVLNLVESTRTLKRLLGRAYDNLRDEVEVQTAQEYDEMMQQIKEALSD